MMGFYEVLDYWRVAEVCDFISDDVYPSWDTEPEIRKVISECAMRHDMHRAMKNGKPFLIMESAPSATNWQPCHRLKRPNQHKLEELTAVGHGADGTLYFQWRKSHGNLEKFHGAVVDHVGHAETRVFRDVAELGALYRKCPALHGSACPVDAAVVFDWESEWAFRTASGPGSLEQKAYTRTVHEHYRALWTANIPLDVIESLSDFSGYRLLIVPMLLMRTRLAKRVEEFVAAGGHWSMTTAPVTDDPPLFLNGCPATVDGPSASDEESADSCLDGDSPLQRQGVRGQEYAEHIHLRSADSVAKFTCDFTGLPAVPSTASERDAPINIAAPRGRISRGILRFGQVRA